MEKLAADEAATGAGGLVVSLADEDVEPGVVAFQFEAVDEAEMGGEAAPMELALLPADGPTGGLPPLG